MNTSAFIYVGFGLGLKKLVIADMPRLSTFSSLLIATGDLGFWAR